MAVWSVEQHVFTVDCYVKTKIVAQIQHSPYTEFGIDYKGHTPAQNTIISWVKHWHERGSVVPMKQKGSKQTVHTLENIAAMRAAFHQVHLVQHRSNLRPLECQREYVRQVLLLDFHCHPYRCMLFKS